MTTIITERNRAIKERLEDVYRCTVGVSSFRDDDVRLSFSHMPHALEGLDRTALYSAVGKALVGIRMVTDEITLSITIRSRSST